MKKLNQILLYCFLAVISCSFYGCKEEEKIEELPLGTGDPNNNDSSENETKEFSVKYVNGSENYLDENGNLRISFTYRKEEKSLSFITESDWEIFIGDNNENKISDWLKITSEDNIEIEDNDNRYIITGKGRKEAFTIKLITEENLDNSSFSASYHIRKQNEENIFAINTFTLSIVKSMPLVKEHNIYTRYCGGIYNHDLNLEYKTNADWIKTNIKIETSIFNYSYCYKVEPNETGNERMCKISISDISGYMIDTLYITQGATKVEKLVNVSAAGTLSNQFTTEEKYQITDLKVNGDLNGDDIRFLREMGGKDYANEETKGVLANLDLYEANIVSGGKPYYSRYSSDEYTSNNEIDDYMFSSLNLVSIILPNSATNIVSYVFTDCYSLKSVKLGQSLKIYPDWLGYEIFSNCISLEKIEIPNSFTSISDRMFKGCINLTEAKLSNNIKSISSEAFSECSKLPSINLPEKLENIEDGVFSGCTSLEEIILPTNVNALGSNVFGSCTSLTKIRCLGQEPPLCSGALGIEETATLYVPAASLEKYKDAAVWKNFKNIVGE